MYDITAFYPQYNHLYWVPASIPNDNNQIMLENWESIVNHVQNIHVQDGQLYSESARGTLEGIERKKKCFDFF